MAEFALVLPILALLLVMAIDFGRVFFGWVGVHNAARIAANYAAQNPLDDYADPTSADFLAYAGEVNADTGGINCDLPTPLSPPSFPGGTAPGGDAVVEFTCDFTPITPLASVIVGSPLTISATSTFPIRSGIVGTPGGGGGGGGANPLCREVPDLEDMTVADARVAWSFAGFSGAFTPAAAAGVDDQLVLTQITDPVSVPGECIDYDASVLVTSEPAPVCGADEAVVPNLVGLSVADARTRWDDNGFDPANFDPSTGSDGQVVTDQTTTPDLPTGECAPDTITIEVDFDDPQPPTPCLVPDFIGDAKSTAQATWTAAGFTTAVQFEGSGQNDWEISAQSIFFTTPADCESTVITVYRHAP